MIDPRELAAPDARGHAMSLRWFLIVLPVGVLSTAAGWASDPADPPETSKNIEAAFKVALASAEAIPKPKP
jgi:hypothetical protein